MHSIKKILGKIPYGRFFLRLLLFFSLFFIIFQVINTQTNRFLRRAAETTVENSYANMAQTTALSLNRVFMEIYQSNYLVGINPTIKDVFSSSTPITTLADYHQIPGVIRTLAKVPHINEYIKSVYIYKRDSNLVISNEAMYDEEEFFTAYHHYAEYDYDFWQAFYNETAFQVLQPTAVGSPSRSSTVLPVVQSKVFDMPSNNLYVVDLNLEKISQMLDGYLVTDQSVIFIAGQGSASPLLTSTRTGAAEDDAFFAAVASLPEDRTYVEVLGEEYFVLTYEAEFFFRPVNIITCVPKKEIFALMNDYSANSYTINVLVFALAAILIVAFSRTAYEPLRALVKSFDKAGGGDKSKANAPKKDEFALIRSYIGEIESNLRETQTELDYTALLADEQVLRKLALRQQLDSDERKRVAQLFDGQAPTVLITIKPILRQTLFTDFSDTFLDELMVRLKMVIQGFFSEAGEPRVFDIAANRIGLLLRPNGHDQQALEQRAYELLALFDTDQQYISVVLVLSHPLTRPEELAARYEQAEHTLSMLSPFAGSSVLSALPETDTEDTDTDEIELTEQQEARLLNLIIAGKRDEVTHELEQLAARMERQGLSGYALQRLFLRFHFIAGKAMRQSGRTLDQAIYEKFISFVNQMDQKPPEQLIAFMHDFFASVMDSVQETSLTLSTRLFKDYIDENYADDLTLASLADKYNTSPQYISRLLKRELGMPLQNYLSGLRVAKAKELLAGTDKPVAEIGRLVGYQSRNTFIRAFKTLEGVTPTEYRGLNRQNRAE